MKNPQMNVMNPQNIRADIRNGLIVDQTSGMAPGFAQGNLVVLPKVWATDFLQFCLANPKPCPLLAVGNPGDPSLPGAGAGIDIRTDLPRYRVFRDGALVDELDDIRALWQDDFVTFLIGCSFSFEGALMDAGIGVRHIELGTNVPMYRTNIQCQSAGPFKGRYVVSMRPFSPADAIRAIEITDATSTWCSCAFWGSVRDRDFRFVVSRLRRQCTGARWRGACILGMWCNTAGGVGTGEAANRNRSQSWIYVDNQY